jgi:selenide,water dikinase
MACASKVTIEIDSAAVPLLEGALELASEGMLTGADKTNREYVGMDLRIVDSVDENLVKLLFDPQTAGGKLIAIGKVRSGELLSELKRNYLRAGIIGRVQPRGERSVEVV